MENQIENILLEFAQLATSEDITQSDLQGIATAQAKTIINLLSRKA